MKTEKYIISIDQSTQGTKALLFDSQGHIVQRADRQHKQIINDMGWVSHDPEEIYQNLLSAVAELLKRIDRNNVVGVGISNQRETSIAWNRVSGKPYGLAIVWQCARAEKICERIAKTRFPDKGNETLISTELDTADQIRQRTGLRLSPYFPAAKIAWILENVEGAKDAAQRGEICYGTMDSYLIFRLTGGLEYRTDYSNASRTQLFNIFELRWDSEICELFGIDPANLAEVCDSDSYFGETDFGGLLPQPVPIHAVLGDSHGALLGQGCLMEGMTKATYGTGSSIMMNIGDRPVLSSHGLVTSLAWKMNGKVNYVLEGNLNYTGAVITWLKDDLELIYSAEETESLAYRAVQDDCLYLVPAFSGLGAPYWDSQATAMLCGMSRTTHKAEVVRAALECIAYQITDILQAMSQDAKIEISELRVDGGPTRNTYLMQFQSNIADSVIRVPDAEELSAIGPAYAVGLQLGMWNEQIFSQLKRKSFYSNMEESLRRKKYNGWKAAIKKLLYTEKARRM